MKRFLIAVLAIFPLAVMAGQGWFQGTLEEAQTTAKAQKKMVVLKFYADW